MTESSSKDSNHKIDPKWLTHSKPLSSPLGLHLARRARCQKPFDGATLAAGGLLQKDYVWVVLPPCPPTGTATRGQGRNMDSQRGVKKKTAMNRENVVCV